MVYQNIINILATHNMAYELIEHEAVYTMEQAQNISGGSPAEGVKVLFVRVYTSKKVYDYHLIAWTGDTAVDFQKITTQLSAKKIRLASSDEVKSRLGIEIGSLTPFGYKDQYPTVLDSALLDQAELYINPGVHDKTIKINSTDLKKLIKQSACTLYII